MITRYTFGKPIATDAAVLSLPAESFDVFPFPHRLEDGCFLFSFPLGKDEIVCGLGEAPRGINKRGWLYRSWCSDDPFHTESKQALYGAHNFLIAGGCGIFIDFPAGISWDIGYTHADEALIRLDGEDFDIYLIRGETPREIVREFRALIGKSYLPPFWGLGYQQSRWSYHNAEAVRNVIRGYEEAGIPLDAVCLDIDYMERYKSFTVNEEAFPEFESFVREVKAQDLHLVPIIDAGVKKEEGYGVYEEGRETAATLKAASGPASWAFRTFCALRCGSGSAKSTVS